MTQDELTLVLEALKWCHGGEPCGTAEAIAVVEKALANVATNDISKEYVDEMQKQRHETVEDNSQQWKGMDGAIAFHLIERHADGWNDIRKMMGEWLSANTPQRTEQEPVAWVWVNNKGWLTYGETSHDMFKSSPLYTHPPQRTWHGLTDEEIDLVCVGLWSGGWRKKAMQDFAKAIEAKLKEMNT